MKTLIVVDMQNDFITGPLGTPEARATVPNVKAKIEEYRKRGDLVIFTKDTHDDTYHRTLEGKHLPVEHCIVGTEGWNIVPELRTYTSAFAMKQTFGNTEWKHTCFGLEYSDSIELIGVCTDICVVSNALILKTTFPEIEITVDANCCAGSTPDNHKAALQVMKACQINIIES